jgi:hypothetical protein
MAERAKQGRPRIVAPVPAGAHVLLAGECAKICRGLVKVHRGREFLALPDDERARFFRRLVVIASTKSKPSDKTRAAVDSAGLDPALIDQVSEVRLKWLVECYDAFPEVTLYVLKRLRARIVGVNKRGRDFWQAWLGYLRESRDDKGEPQGKLEEGAREALSQMRKVAVRNKTRRRATIESVK